MGTGETLSIRFWFTLSKKPVAEVSRSVKGLCGHEPGFWMPVGSVALGFRERREFVMKICTAVLFITKKTGNNPNCPPQGQAWQRVPYRRQLLAT